MSNDKLATLQELITDQLEVVRQIEQELADAERHLGKISLKLDILMEQGTGIPDLDPELRSLEGEVALFEAQVRNSQRRLETQQGVLNTLTGILEQWR